MSQNYCIIGFEYNEPMNGAEFYTKEVNEYLQTTDDMEKAKHYSTLPEAQEDLKMLKQQYNDYGWYILIC